MPLAEAREKAIDNRRVARAGGDPLAEKRRALVPTFKAALEETIKAMRGRWRKGSPTESIWRRTLEKHAGPFMEKPVNAITREDVLRVLTPVWTSKPEVAKRTRQFTRSVLSWAQAHGYVEHNVAGEAIAGGVADRDGDPSAPSGVAVGGRSRGAASRGCFQGRSGRQALFPAHGGDRGTERRSPVRQVVRVRPGSPDMDDTGRADEGWHRTPGAAV